MENSKIRIIEAGNSLGLGGTEYVIQLYCKYLNKEFFQVTALGIFEGGERVSLIEENGVKVVLLNGDLNQLAGLLKETDVFHWHGNGKLDPEVFKIVADNKPKLVIQTNVFGNFRESILYQSVDYDLYVSKMIMIRRMYYDSYLKNNVFKKRRVLYNPVDIEQLNQLLPDEDEISSFKIKHNLTDKFIIGRVGRADRAKFDLINLDAFAEFASEIRSARFLLVGATEILIEHARQLGIEDKLIVLENTIDLKQLLLYYKCIDIFVAASHIGESFGMVIAEAMIAGVPVITISTPDKDNAQIELVDNEVTGIVVKRDTSILCRAMKHLYSQPELRKSLAENARQKISKTYHAASIVRSLEDLIYHHLKMGNKSKQPSLLLKYSREMVDDYNYRITDLWEPE
ncbi:MAG: glycosyltransferase family 4 protein [Pedobacter sp.]|nr:glycosyltransferase family 4 protein [Pedobacter sp.]